MYDLGILGGMGPLATSLLFELIMSCTKAESDQEHLNVLIANKAIIPDRTAYLLDRAAENPLAQLIEGIKELNALSPKYIAIPCNTSHYFIEELQKASSAPIINMVENALQYIHADGLPKTVVVLGTLGTVKTRIYERFNRYGLTLEYPSEEECEGIHHIIYSVKHDGKRAVPQCLEALMKIIKSIKERTGEEKTFVLGCTELSVLGAQLCEKDESIVDAMAILALSAVTLSEKDISNNYGYHMETIKKITSKQHIS